MITLFHGIWFSMKPCNYANIQWNFFVLSHIKVHADSKPLFPHLHGAGLDLLSVHDSEEHRAGEGDEAEGDAEGHGRH